MKDPETEKPMCEPQKPQLSASHQQAKATNRIEKKRANNMAENNVGTKALPPPPELMQPSLVSWRKKMMIRIRIDLTKRYVTSAKWNTITVKKLGMISESVPSQKTSFDIGNLRVGSWN